MSSYNFLDLIGKRFGRLLVIERSKNGKNQNAYWLCRCDCGKEKIIRGAHIQQGKIQSCGCLRVETGSKNGKASHPQHGHDSASGASRTYMSWASMIQRCTNPHDEKRWKHYGGRGITVCREWLNFKNFLTDMGERPVGKEIDRINNDGNYEPYNCRWATRKQQMNNTRKVNNII